MANSTVSTSDMITSLMDSVEGDSVQIQDSTHLKLIHSLDHLPELYADALGLKTSEKIYMHIRLASEFTFGAQFEPTIEISVGEEKLKWIENRNTEPSDKAIYQINKISEAYAAQNWPPKSKREAISYLKNLYRHLQSRIARLGDFCVVCGMPQDKSGLKPIPCDSQACNFAFDELGIGAGLSDIYNRPNVADLLISMATSASYCSQRRENFFHNLPSDLLQGESEEKGVKGKKKSKEEINSAIDWSHVQSAFGAFPSLEKMRGQKNLQNFFVTGKDESVVEIDPKDESPSKKAKTLMEELYPGYEKVTIKEKDPKDGLLEFKLLRWVLNSSRGHLMQLNEEEKFSDMQTPHQFRLCTDSPAKEANFANLKAEKGSCFLFHGSGFYNWHSILKVGLKNFSGTNMMSAGAAYGSGIYLASNSSTSSGYSKGHNSGPSFQESIYGVSPKCIALCEVINDSFNEQTRGGYPGIKVIPDAQNVITRYLFVYDDTTQIPFIESSKLGALCQKHAKAQEEAVKNLQGILESFATEPANLESLKAENDPKISEDSRSEKEGSEFEGSEEEDGNDGNSSAYDFSYCDSDDDCGYEAPVQKSEEELKALKKEREAQEELEARFGAVSSGTQQRLLKELKQLKKSDTRSEGFEIDVVDDDLSNWEAKVWIDTDCSLGKDLQAFNKIHGRDYVTLRLRFGNDYPNMPPFVWVLSPVFKAQTGFVSRGAVCTNMLLASGSDGAWSPIYTAEIIIRQIRANFQSPDAKGKIANINKDESYTEEQARAGWTHAKSMHNWR